MWPSSPLPASPLPAPASCLINDLLGADHLQCIFDQLNEGELSKCKMICKKWSVLINKRLVNRLIAEAERTRVLIEEKFATLPIPENLRTFLEKDSPFWKGKKNYHTRPLIAFIPSTTLNEFLTWAETKGLSLDGMFMPILEEHGNTPMQPRWVVMTPVVPGSRGKPYETGNELATKPDQGFQGAKLAEATVCIAIQILLGREYTYGQDPWTYTRCEELHEGRYHVVVGGDAPPSAASLGGLYVNCSYIDIVSPGVAALSKF